MNSEHQGTIVDVVSGRIFTGTVTIRDGRIITVSEHPVQGGPWILPGFTDAHIHIESSMLIPSGFARLAVVHGTTATVSDPHEIANVVGIEGVEFMIRNGKKVPFKFNFGAPSCVPATGFETSGACLDPAGVDQLLGMKEIRYLSEMMNFPGVLNDDPDVTEKLAAARRHGKPVDGHAPGLSGPPLQKYIGSGISTDHECFTLEEAREKAEEGMHILIREGSAARNFEALHPLIASHPGQVMFCSDDKHPDDLAEGHINQLIVRALAKGYPLVDVLRCCTLNPARHYSLDTGLLQPGDPADLVLVSDPESFRILEVFVNGQKVASRGVSLIGSETEEVINRFSAEPVSPVQLEVPAQEGNIRVIRVLDGQLITGCEHAFPTTSDGKVRSDPARDILKLVVVNRYSPSPPAIGFIAGFGMQRGAIASSVAHDSHNIVAVGADDESLARAINRIIGVSGGISLVDGRHEEVLPLPFAGLMTGDDGYAVASAYRRMDLGAKGTGSALRAPYMTLSFMALLVIPELKLSDRGLFSGSCFSLVPLFDNNL